MNAEQGRHMAGESRVARARRRRLDEARIQQKRLGLIQLLGGDDAERERLSHLSYAQLVCLKHATPPQLPISDPRDRANEEEVQ